MLEDNISSIGELREHWEIHKQLLLENNLHEDIVELKAWFHENTAEGRIFNVTYLLENRDESFNTTLQKPEQILSRNLRGLASMSAKRKSSLQVMRLHFTSRRTIKNQTYS